jgi:ABC-type transporter Mla subunit MlaD
MTTDPALERRVERLENEAVAIYDLIKDETKDIRGTLEQFKGRFDGVTATLEQFQGRFDGVTATLEQFQGRFDGVTATLDQHTDQLAEILRRLP